MTDEKLWIKAEIAAKVFITLTEHRGTAVLTDLTENTVKITNNIFKGIQED